MYLKASALSLSIMLITACGSNGGGGSTDAISQAVPITHFFPADNGSNAEQLWKTDGTEAGTVMVKVINAGGSAQVKVLGSVGGKAIFTAKDGIHGRELWVTEGTEAGTNMLKDINTGSPDTSINTFAAVGETLYFDAYDITNGNELWKTDGTTAGTVMVKDINPGSNGSGIDDIVVLGNKIYFRATDGVNGVQLWKSDGTAAGTVAINVAVTPNRLAVSNGTIYFNGYESVNGTALWKSDGTAAGTVMVADITLPGTPDYGISDIVSMGGNIYFLAAESTAQGEELWRSDGTASGTTLVKNINTQTAASFNNNSSSIRYLAATSNKLFFTARPDKSVTTAELWVSDGTEAGTLSLYSASSVSDITVTENGVYFDGYDAIHGEELWKTDGTLAGTALLKDVVPGTDGSYFYSLAYYGYYNTPSPTAWELSDGSVLMMGATAETGSELWKTDGTAAGTVMVKDINPDMGDAFDN